MGMMNHISTVQVAKEIARIPNPGTRKTAAEAIWVLVRIVLSYSSR
jgi:hypothetical protein